MTLKKSKALRINLIKTKIKCLNQNKSYKIKKKKIETKNFPFEKPRGIISSSKDNSSFPFKFITKKYFITENGKRKPIKKKEI